MEQQKEYRSIVKATALFGGVQAFQVLLALVRTKVVALLLGVDGVGLLGLLNNTISMVQSITGLGINQGGVKSISAAETPQKAAQMASLVRQMSLYAGLFGSIVILTLAPWLSQWSFGNRDFTGAYIWLACTLLFDTLTKGELAIFQGFRRLRILAQANLLGASAGLLISIPIYYIWRTDGIVGAIIISSVCSYLATLVFRSKQKVPSLSVHQEGKSIITIGAMLTISGFASTLVSYLFNIYLRSHGGLQDVGIYQSGFGLIDKYIGLIFIAMSTDYYPRLAAAHVHNTKLKHIMNQQTVVSLLILCPVIAIFLPTAPLIVRLLLTESFLPVIPFLSWAILGMIFKVTSTSLGYILIVKGAHRLFLGSELLSWSTILITNIIGYNLWGIEGIGIAFLFSYTFYLIIMTIICKKAFNITFNKEVLNLFLFTIIIATISFLSIYYLAPINPWAGYTLCTLLIIFSALIAMRKLWHHIK
ncbi:O-antigen translocase [Bacteroides sp.]